VFRRRPAMVRSWRAWVVVSVSKTSRLTASACPGAAWTRVVLPLSVKMAVDAVFGDLALHTEFAGVLAIGAYVSRACTRLPYGPGTSVRRTLGSGRGGGYEWTGSGFLSSHGIIAVELDAAGRITRFTAAWDASRLDDAAMAALLADTLEH
jgi:hypothetical protein